MIIDTSLEQLSLQRVPAAPSLQAWNAADELCLQRLAESAVEPASILVVNDAFGALAIALGDAVKNWWNDSAMARDALSLNCQANGKKLPTVVEQPTELATTYSLVVLQAPKSLAFFDWQLSEIASRLSAHGKLLVLGMVKHLSKGHQNIMARHFKSVNPGRAVKKARCVELSQPTVPNLKPAVSRTTSPQGHTLINHPGSFSEKGIDPGALAFLQLFDQLPVTDTVLDLGCGNGILGVTYLKNHPECRGVFIDESFQAVLSAKDSLVENHLNDRATVFHNNGLSGLALTDLPLILCNPPFHQQTTLTDEIADLLFKHAHDALASDGEFWIVGNRHLDYHLRLKRWFQSVDVKSKHPKFTVLKCRKPK